MLMLRATVTDEVGLRGRIVSHLNSLSVKLPLHLFEIRLLVYLLGRGDMREQRLVGLSIHQVAWICIMHLSVVRLALGESLGDTGHLSHDGLSRLQVSLSWLRLDLLERLCIIEISVFVFVPCELVMTLNDAVSDALS